MNIVKKSLFIAANIILAAFVIGQFSDRNAKRNVREVSVEAQKRQLADAAAALAAAERERELAEKQKRLIEEYKAKEKKQFQEFMQKHLSSLKREELDCAGKAASDLYWRIIGYKSRAHAFAEEVSGIFWCTAKDHEVRACFEKHVFGEYTVNNMIKDAANDFVSKSAANRSRFNEGIVSEAKAGYYKYLSKTELNSIAAVSMVNYNLNFDAVLGKVEFRDYAFYRGGGFGGGVVASAITEFILGRVLALLAARAAIIGAGVGSSWCTFGISLVVGYAVDKYATEQFIKNVEAASVACIQKTANDASENLKKGINDKLQSEFVAVP